MLTPGVLIDLEHASGFEHVGTAWQIATGEWITALGEDQELTASTRLLVVGSGQVVAISDAEREGDVVGFRAADDHPATLAVAEQVQLSKRQPLWAMGYPTVIEHPAFRLHRGSLDGERYRPYLCPWQVQGHLTLFTLEEGWLTGATYPGMRGGPVLDADGLVVGVLLSSADAGSPPLTRFRRIA